LKTRSPDIIDTRAHPRRAVTRALQTLRAGGVVLVPTETVYGLIADAAIPQAVDKMYSIKGRERAKPLAFLMADRRDIRNFIPSVPDAAGKLAQRYWPGPLTLVLDNGRGEQLGLRVPGNAITRTIIRRSASMIHGTSANRSGQRPAITAQNIPPQLARSVDLILDAGPCPLGQPSTVVRVSDSSWEILRPGAIDEDKIELLVNKLILFLCSGNSCRSPMAEGICRMLLSRKLAVTPSKLKNRGYTVLSAGLSAVKGDAPAKQAVIAMRQLGIEIAPHKSRPLTHDLAKRADLIFLMDSSLFASARSPQSSFLAPLRGKTRLLADGIPDPYGGSIEHYSMCARKLIQAISNVLDQILA